MINKFTVYFLLLIFTSCNSGKEIAQNLNSKQSAEIIVALSKTGITSERLETSSGKKVLYKVYVANSDYARALEVLTEYELPKIESNEFDNLINDSSYLSSELSSIKANRALAIELERLLAEFPGVISANVLIRKDSANSSLLNKKVKQSASIVLKYGSSSPSAPPFNRRQVLRVIEKSLPGVRHEDISLSVLKVESPNAWLSRSSKVSKLKYVRPFAFRVPQEDLNRAKYQIIGVLVLICFAGFLLGGVSFLLWLRKRYGRTKVKSILTQDRNADVELIEE